jgi:hypothetical protein
MKRPDALIPPRRIAMAQLQVQQDGMLPALIRNASTFFADFSAYR